MRPFFAFLLALTTLGCSDDEPVVFRSTLPFDAIAAGGETPAAYGLRIKGEERVTLCKDCMVLAKSPVGDHALLQEGAQDFFIAEPGRVNEVLDLTSAAVDGPPLELPGKLEAVWSPDSSRLALLWGTTEAFVAAGNGTSIVPVITGELNSSSEGPSIVWSPDGSHVAFALADGAFAITDAAGSSTLPIPSGSSGPAWSPDGGFFAYTNAGVSVVDTGTLETRLVSATATRAIGWSASGAWFAYMDGALVLAPSDDSRPTTLPLDVLSTAAWSPVADQLLYGGYTERDGPGVDVALGLWSPDDSLSLPLATEVSNRLPETATWSPDGTRFLYRLADSDLSAHSALVDASDGSELARYPAVDDPVPTFNRDGSLLAIASSNGGGLPVTMDLEVSDASGTEGIPIGSNLRDWMWLGDGEHLALVNESSVAIVRADGSELSTRITGAELGIAH